MAALISHLKPDQTLIIVALLGLFVGTMLWLAGYRLARPALTMVLAALGAFLGYLAPVMWHWPLVNIASAIIMAIIGALLGSIGFRFMQAVLVAALVAITILSAFALQHPGTAPPHTQPAPRPMAAPAVAPAHHQSNARLQQIWNNAKAYGVAWQKTVLQMPPAARNTAVALASGAALAALVLAVLFRRTTSVVATACVGTAILTLCLLVLGRAFAPKLLAHWQGRLNLSWLVPGAAGAGILLQVAQLLHQSHHQKKETAKKAEAKKSG